MSLIPRRPRALKSVEMAPHEPPPLGPARNLSVTARFPGLFGPPPRNSTWISRRLYVEIEAKGTRLRIDATPFSVGVYRAAVPGEDGPRRVTLAVPGSRKPPISKIEFFGSRNAWDSVHFAWADLKAYFGDELFSTDGLTLEVGIAR